MGNDRTKWRFLILGIAVAGFVSIPFANYWQSPKINEKSLVIGTLGSPKYQQSLVKYLRDELSPNNFIDFILRKSIDVRVDGNENLSYQDAKNALIQKKWDIAFTLSPMLSVVAKDNKYQFAARMFPDRPSFYQSGIYVRSNSSIYSLKDLKPTTVIALGAFNSASSFYMPVYDLFGKTLKINMGHRGTAIREMLKSGNVDVGAGAIGDTVDPNDQDFRIIHQSRNIPSAGVYLSPNLTEQDRNTIKKLLLNAPKAIKKQANYDADKEPDYSAFLGIVRRTEQVLSCSNFQKNPVSLFCQSPQSNVLSENTTTNGVIGTVNGWKAISEKVIWLNLVSASDKRIYNVEISREIINQIPGITNIVEINNRKIQVNSQAKELTDASWIIRITQANQLVLLN
ncbi:PhnD/SsuA/transferrin family substrate-binding protein [Nostoc sp. FACHB-892]|uniref:phosphate/phosphite/phosphonate ABC transporter substrate-binding protein n=1 Tax=Nostoc sp. FACHB-892 TaxID=2692843 RepID=UPI0016858215|nr:PhnD/SsuA/transferrin family substrate-binding protein [Nostoc sp. FACHB-892]MBD2730261.1 PhnD/SsuA/transferrin family substrate-binding protein [Nostoc sp. FACHB-892]